MGLFGKTKKQEHLIDGKLPLGWVGRNKDFTLPIEQEHGYFLNNWVDSRNKSPKEYYSALKSFILYLEDCRSLCASKGECNLKWFQGIIADDEYIEQENLNCRTLKPI